MDKLGIKQIAIIVIISLMLLLSGTLITLFINNYLINNYNKDEIVNKATFVYRDNLEK